MDASLRQILQAVVWRAFWDHGGIWAFFFFFFFFPNVRPFIEPQIDSKPVLAASTTYDKLYCSWIPIEVSVLFSLFSYTLGLRVRRFFPLEKRGCIPSLLSRVKVTVQHDVSRLTSDDAYLYNCVWEADRETHRCADDTLMLANGTKSLDGWPATPLRLEIMGGAGRQGAGRAGNSDDVPATYKQVDRCVVYHHDVSMVRYRVDCTEANQGKLAQEVQHGSGPVVHTRI